MSDQVFGPSSVQSRQFQTLALLTIMPSQHMNPVDENQLLFLGRSVWGGGGGSIGLTPQLNGKFVS